MTKPAVCFDTSILAHSVGGISRYLTSLADAVSGLDEKSGVVFKTVDVPATHPGTRSGLTADAVLHDPMYLQIPFLRRLPIRNDWELKSRRKRLSSLLPECDIYHTSGVQPVCPTGSHPVITVYDMSAIDNPQWHTSETVEFARAEMKLIENGAYAISISRWTADRLLERMGNSIDKEHICVAGGAADDFFTPGGVDKAVLSKYALRENSYLLHVGNFVPRKHIPFIIDVHSDACTSGFNMPLVLVGAGRWGNLNTDSSNVIILENIPDDTLLTLYRGARALLFPSECEGLGLPALEAMACGTPVIASDAGALAETIGDDGVILPVGDSRIWKKEINSLRDNDYINYLNERVRKHRRPVWEDVAKRVCSFYRRLP